MRFLFIALVGLSSFLHVSTTNAADYGCSSFGFTVSPPDITIPNGLNVGDKIGNVVSGSYTYAYICSNVTTSTTQVTGFKALGEYAMSAGDGTRIYKTNIAGIGYAVGGYNGNCQVTGWVSTGTKILGDANTIQLCTVKDNAIAVTPQIQLYKIAQTTGSGSVSGKQWEM